MIKCKIVLVNWQLIDSNRVSVIF